MRELTLKAVGALTLFDLSQMLEMAGFPEEAEVAWPHWYLLLDRGRQCQGPHYQAPNPLVEERDEKGPFFRYMGCNVRPCGKRGEPVRIIFEGVC